MPHETTRTYPVMRRHARQISHDVGPGSWQEEQCICEITDDAKALVVVTVVPLPKPSKEATLVPDSPQRGHPCAAALDILYYVWSKPSCCYTDILEAMEAIGHGRVTASDNLRVLVQRGLILHPQKNGPYHVAQPDRIRLVLTGQTAVTRQG